MGIPFLNIFGLPIGEPSSHIKKLILQVYCTKIVISIIELILLCYYFSKFVDSTFM